MLPIPAIDIINSQCVRLTLGDYQQKTAYKLTPLAWAKEVELHGFPWIHIVDLDRAKDQNTRNTALIAEIAKNTSLSIQTGGGIRTEADILELLELGVKKVVIGSLAVKNPNLVKSWIKQFGGDTIILAADSLNGQIACEGWQESSQLSLADFIQDFIAAGAKEFLCTDISKDGALQGPNCALYQSLKTQFPQAKIIASGGVSCLQDIHDLEDAGVESCVIGKALFEGRFSLEELKLSRNKKSVSGE